MDQNDLKILRHAKKATLCSVVEDVSHCEIKPWWKRILFKDKAKRKDLSEVFNQHPDMVSINRLVVEGFLEKGEKEEFSHTI